MSAARWLSSLWFWRTLFMPASAAAVWDNHEVSWRDEAAKRLEDMCGLNPTAVGSGPIDPTPNKWWCNKWLEGDATVSEQRYSGYDVPMDGTYRPLSDYPDEIAVLAEVCEDTIDADWSFDGRYGKAGTEASRQYAIRQLAHFLMLAREIKL